jgi:hypothetical protein
MEPVEDTYGIGHTWDLWDDSSTISSTVTYNSTERQTMATEIMKGMVSSGLLEEPEDMAKEAVRLADALLAELRK